MEKLLICAGGAVDKIKRIVQLFIEKHLAQYENDVLIDFKSNLICKAKLEIDEVGYSGF